MPLHKSRRLLKRSFLRASSTIINLTGVILLWRGLEDMTLLSVGLGVSLLGLGAIFEILSEEDGAEKK